MKTNLCRILAACVLSFPLVACGAHDDFLRFNKTATSGTIVPESQFLVLQKSAVLESFICENIYPAPKSELECHEQMERAMEKAFPLGLQKAETMGFASVPAQFETDPVATVLWRLNARMFGECRSDANFAACVDEAYRTLSSAFDPHSGYINKEEFAEMMQSNTGSFSGIGLEVGGLRKKGDPMIALNPIEGSPAERAGLLSGDIIVGISKDGTDSAMRPIGSYETLNEAVRDIRGVRGTTVRLLIERPGEAEKRTFNIVRGVIDTQMVKHALLTEGEKRYGVIHIRQFQGQSCKKTADAYKKLLALANGKLDGLIVSVERDPGGLLYEAQCVLDLFTDAKSFVLERGRDSVQPYPLLESHPGDITNGTPILVMVNGGSASASEIFAAGMKHMGRAVVAGTPTFGKVSVQTIMPLGDGTALKLMSSEYLVGTEADWIPVQCLGVTPDVAFDRGLDPKDKDGKRITDCGLEHSIRSGGPMRNPPRHDPIQVANPAHYAKGVEMLEAYKKHVAPEDVKLKKQQELFKKMFEDEEKEKEKK